MAADYALFLGWNRPVPGREAACIELFGQVTAFWEKHKTSGSIESFEHCFLHANGGTVNGFTLVRGDQAKLDKIRASEEFLEIATRCNILIQDFSVIPAFIGEQITKQVGRYMKAIPR